MSTVSFRVREHRARQKAGRVVLAVEVDEVKLVAALIDSRLLDATAADDREAIERATEKLIEEIT